MGFKDFVKQGWENNRRNRQQVTNDVALGVFQALSVCDWIMPLIGIGQTVYHDPTPLQTNSWAFWIPYNQALKSGWNANDIQNMLKRKGIDSWTSQVVNGEFHFTVSLDNAAEAEYLLLRHGIPLSERFVGAPPPKNGE